MASAPSEQQVGRLVPNLFEVGSGLTALVPNLIAGLRPEGSPGEEPETVVLDMLTGLTGAVRAATNPRSLQHATELIDLAASRTRERLRLTRVMSRRMQDGDDGVGRAHG